MALPIDSVGTRVMPLYHEQQSGGQPQSGPLPAQNVTQTQTTQAPQKQPLPPEQQRVDDALKQLESSQQALAAAGAPSTYQFLQENVSHAQKNLKEAIDAELKSREAKLPPGQKADDATLKQWGEDIAARYPGNASRQTEIRRTVEDVRTGRLAEPVIAAAKAESDPAKALKILSDGFGKAPPEVQQKILQHPDAAALLDRAVKWANEPLTRDMNSAQTSPQAYSREAIQRLDTLTRGLDKKLAGEVAARAMPEYERFNSEFQGNFGSDMFGPEGVKTLMHLGGRIAGTPAGDAALNRFAKIGGFNEDSMRNAIAEGESPAYLLEFARVNKDYIDMGRTLGIIDSGLAMHRQSINEDLKSYAKETEELQWLIRQNSGWMSDKQLQASIDQYKAAKEAADPGWQQRVTDLEAKLADRGKQLLEQLAPLGKLPPELADQQGKVNDLIANTLGAQESQAAVSLALQKQPDIMAGDQGLALKNMFATIKSGHEARKLLPNVANAYVKANVYGHLTNLDPNNPASVAQAQKALDGLKGSAMAKLLGVSEADLDKAVSQLKSTLPVKGESVDAVVKKLEKLDDTVSNLGTFKDSTLAGVMFRALGVVGAGSSFINSLNRFNNDPTWAPAVKLFTDASGLGRSFAELIKAADRGGGITAAMAGKTAGALNAFAAIGDAALAVDAYNKGDGTSAALFGVTAVGGALAAAPAVVAVVPGLAASASAASVASFLGPIGIGLVIAGTVGNAIWADVKASNIHDNDQTAKFLEAANFNPQTARALVDQSGDGHSPVPILMKYGQMHGLTADQTVKWLNSLTPDQLATTRNVVHITLDKLGGDISKFNMTAANDKDYIQGAVIQPGTSGAVPAESRAQLDTVLSLRGIPWPKA